MAGIERLSISLSKELAEMVRGAVTGGEYTTSSEVVREALRDWKLKKALQETGIAQLREEVQAGLDDLDNDRATTIANEGDGRSFLEGIKKRGREKLAALHTK